MKADELKQLIEGGREAVSLEFKESQLWDTLKLKIVKCILAMTNTRDGGHLVIGVKDDGTPLGVDAAHLSSYDEEIVKDTMSNYADPYVDFEMDIADIDGKNYILFTIREFTDQPVICKRTGDGLELGAIYIRTRNRRPESVKVSDALHMRELIDLAVDKSVTRLRQRGLTHQDSGNSQAQFEEQIRELDI